MNHSEVKIINGCEAVAYGAVYAHVDYFAHYPGSPVNTVEPALKKLTAQYDIEVKFNDSLNEHIALLSAAGASLCGARSLVVMKHVGLNIAADPANYLGVTKLKGGMVIVVGTDPGATCSTGEEDVHWYVPQFNFPLLEPVTVAGTLNSISEGFRISEKYQVPVMVFLPAALCFNSDTVKLPHPVKVENKIFHFEKDKSAYTHVGKKAVEHHREHIARIEACQNQEWRVQEHFAKQSEIGIVTRGLGYHMAYESIIEQKLEEKVHLINLEMVYPLGEKQLLEFFEKKSKVLIIEDQDGFSENQIKNILFNKVQCEVYGKRVFPAFGELEFAQVQQEICSLLGIKSPYVETQRAAVPERLGTYCEGCPHRSIFYGIDKATENTDTILGGDIGCSSLPPHRPDWLLCMNAGIGLSQGMAHVLQENDRQSIISTGGEGSFFHMGLTHLQNAVINRIPFFHIILDNRVVAMTGHQASPTTPNTEINTDVPGLLKAIGVDHVLEADAFLPFEVEYRIKQAQKLSGVKVLWVKGNCAFFPDEEIIQRRKTRHLKIHNEKCNGCRECYEELACPAINLEPNDKDIYVDSNRCMRCGVCLEICPNKAIEVWNV